MVWGEGREGVCVGDGGGGVTREGRKGEEGASGGEGGGGV